MNIKRKSLLFLAVALAFTLTACDSQAQNKKSKTVEQI